MKEVVIMANKKTVIELYEEILANPTLTAEQKTFIEKRIEITRKKNASGGGEPTPKQKEQMALNAEIEQAVVTAMVAGTQYSTKELVKLLNRNDVASTQKLTPRLTALVADGKLNKATVKGASVYSLPVAEVEDTATEN
jgi:hypothetical protein